MAENPNITELDSDYEPKENSAVEINGALPGEGDGVSYWTKDADGNLVPAGGEPLSVEEAVIGQSQVYVQDTAPSNADTDDVWIDTNA